MYRRRWTCLDGQLVCTRTMHAAQQAVAADTLRFGRFAPSTPRAAEPRAVSGTVAARHLSRLKVIRSISPFGINIVVNEHTVRELDEAAGVATDSGACELLLLPQVQVRSVSAITAATMRELRRWVDGYGGPLKLCINEAHTEGFPTCDPLVEERGLRAYAHIDATGVIKPSSYHGTGVAVGEGGVLEALDLLAQDIAEDDL